MKIEYINNSGGGFAGEHTLTDGITISQFFAKRFPDHQPDDFTIKVNGQRTTADTILQDGDRVSVTPLKIQGACLPNLVGPSQRARS